ncbi:MAG: Crp/Fnr family transcriptional regulator [Gammaproteobacteria bacterium]|nr:Crp/Fnr family transcriptional regulator [Gammaproteobacteria bacterium]
MLSIDAEELHRLSLFRSTRFSDVQDVLSHCSVLRIDAGKIVIAARQPNKRLYLVSEGELSVRLHSLDSEPVATICAGEMFGELSAIDGEYTSAYVMTETPCKIVGIDGDSLWELFSRTPHVAHNLMTTLAARLRESNKVIEDLQRESES